MFDTRVSLKDWNFTQKRNALTLNLFIPQDCLEWNTRFVRNISSIEPSAEECESARLPRYFLHCFTSFFARRYPGRTFRTSEISVAYLSKVQARFYSIKCNTNNYQTRRTLRSHISPGTFNSISRKRRQTSH